MWFVLFSCPINATSHSRKQKVKDTVGSGGPEFGGGEGGWEPLNVCGLVWASSERDGTNITLTESGPVFALPVSLKRKRLRPAL